MKLDWELRKLEEVCEMYQPKTIGTKDMSEKGLYPVFGANGIIGKYDKFNHEEPQLLLTCRGATCGAVNISEPKSWINGNAMVIRPKSQDINFRFLEYVIRYGINISKIITGAAQPQITRQSLNPVEISYPKSLKLQNQIVQVLDECFEAIDKAKANTEKSLKNAKELFDSYLQGVFEAKGDGWEEMKLGEMATLRNGVNYLKESKGEKIKIVGVKDFQNNYWVPDGNLDEISLERTLSDIDILKEGDILAVRSNGNPQLIGRTLLVGKITGKVSHSGFTIRIRLNSNIIDSNYLCHYLKIQGTRRKLVESGNGVGIKSLNQGSLSSLVIPFPKSLNEQRVLIERVDSIAFQCQKLQEVYQQKLTYLEELKKSILQKAFAGELETVKEVML